MRPYLLRLICVLFLSADAGAILAEEPRFLGKDPRHWIEQLQSAKPSARRAAAFALGKLGTAAYTHGGIALLEKRNRLIFR